MGRVLTNNVSLSYAIEATETDGSRAIGFLAGEDPGDGGAVLSGAPTWKLLEPNNISVLGSTVEKVARNPIRRARGRQKGTLSNLTSAVEFDADITVDSFLDFAEGFMFSRFSNSDIVFRGSDAETTTDTYTVPSLSAAQAAKIIFVASQAQTLLRASGYTVAANNGLKTVDAAVSATDTAIGVVENLSDETAPSNARLEIAGIEFPDGEVASFAVAAQVSGVSGRIGTLTLNNFNMTPVDLRPGQVVYLQFPGSTVRGYAIVQSVASSVVTFTGMDAALTDAPTVSGAATRILFGQFAQDVPSDNSSFIQRSFQFEADYPGLATDSLSSAFEYPRGNFCSTLNLTLDLNDKGTFSAAFVGTDTDVPTETRKVVATVSPADALNPLGTEAFSTVSDFARLRITDIDEDGLTTDIKTVELAIDNNVSPENVLNRLGARFINFGNFFVDLTMSIVFTDGNVLARIRENTTVSLDIFLQNGDGVLAFSIKSMTLGDGTKDLPVDETVLLNITGEAFEDPVTLASLSVSFIPSVP